MTDPKQAWDEVSDAFQALGLKLKMHAEQALGPADRDQLDTALRELRDKLQQGVGALDRAMKDPAVKADLDRVAQSLSEALNATFTGIGDQLRDTLRRDQ